MVVSVLDFDTGLKSLMFKIRHVLVMVPIWDHACLYKFKGNLLQQSARNAKGVLATDDEHSI